MTLQSRLKHFISSQGLSISAFERECGLSNGFVSKVGDSIRREKLDLISKRFPELNIDWVINQKGNMLIQDNEVGSCVCELTDGYSKVPKVNTNTKEVSESDYVLLLPVEAMAGSLQGFSDGVSLRDCRKIKSPVNGADWAIQISGDSMEPEYRNGSYIFIKKMTGSFIPWGHTMVLDTRDAVVVKNIFPVDGADDIIEARSINTKYPPFKIETSCIIGIYRVLGGSFINSTI